MVLSQRKCVGTVVLACFTRTYMPWWRRALTRQLDCAMPLPPLIGHERVKTRLAGAHATGKLPQALLLAGPRGVGKQRLALWLAQLIQCEAPGSTQEPCGECRSCRLVLSLQHPDVHWFVPLELGKRGAGGGGGARKKIEPLARAPGRGRGPPRGQAPCT